MMARINYSLIYGGGGQYPINWLREPASLELLSVLATILVLAHGSSWAGAEGGRRVSQVLKLAVGLKIPREQRGT
jgi:hypothetical protein